MKKSAAIHTFRRPVTVLRYVPQEIVWHKAEYRALASHFRQFQNPDYMKPFRFIAIFLFLALANPARCQSETVMDSLRQLIGRLSPQDTLYPLNLCRLAALEGFSDPATAAQRAQEALGLSKKMNFVPGELFALTLLALGLQRQGRYSEALQYYLPAIALAEEEGNRVRLAKIVNNLGILYHLSEDYPKALEQFRRALALQTEAAERAYVLGNIGLVFSRTAQPDSALSYYRAALEVQINLNDARGLASNYNNIGLIYLRRNDLKNSSLYFSKAMALFRQNNNLEAQASTLGNVGEVLLRQGQYRAAEDTLRQAFELARLQQALGYQMDAAKHLYTLFAVENRYPAAYEWLLTHQTLKDSLRNLEQRDELAAIRARFESDQKVTLLEKNIAIERNRRLLWTASAIGLLLALAGLLYILQQVRRRRRLENALQDEEIARLRIEDEARRLREEKLHETLEHRSRELTSQTLHLVQQNELLQSVAQRLKEAGAQPDPAQLRTLKRLIEGNLNNEAQWEDFKRHFELVHPDFFRRLLLRFPNLTAHDLRYCAYLRLNLSSKEIAALLNVSLRGVETHRHRLRKKLSMDAEQDLIAWIMQI
ncbi:MAG: tetratricopeptide repeat protein [Saprospiraceae bacterium]